MAGTTILETGRGRFCWMPFAALVVGAMMGDGGCSLGEKSERLLCFALPCVCGVDAASSNNFFQSVFD